MADGSIAARLWRLRLSFGSCLLALIWLCSVPCQAQVTLDSVPGGLAEIPLGSLDRPAPQAYFGQERILVLPFAKQWVALVGLPLGLVPGSYVIRARLEKSEDAITRNFTVYPRRFDGEPVVQAPASPLDSLRIRFAWRDVLDAKLPLDAPVPEPARPIFGRYRKGGSGEAAYVDFITFRIDSNASVKAPGDGKVAAVKSGGPGSGAYVWIDHGMSLYTCVGPLTRTAVHEGDTVKAGQSLGRVDLGEAGKPKSLFWSVFLNGAAVDPFLISDTKRESLPGSRSRAG